MAEPMSSNEIEDVLSSIRRLVAQDLKPSDRAKLAAVADTAQKLVLAPNQRIEDDPASDARFVTVRRPSRRAAFPPVEAVLAGVSAVTGGGRTAQADEEGWALGARAGQNAVPDYAQGYADMAQNLRADAPSFDAPPAFQTQTWQGDVIAPAASTEDEPELGDEFGITPNARLFDSPPPDFTDDFSPAYGENVDPALTPAPHTWPAHDSEPDEIDPAQAEHSPVESLHGTIEPDPQWADAAEARVIAELSGQPLHEDAGLHDSNGAPAQGGFREPNFAAQPPLSSGRQTEVLFDEDQLRAMVQTIFREEMAGPMGERITRNIRKLVRAEVGRMLAAQDLE